MPANPELKEIINDSNDCVIQKVDIQASNKEEKQSLVALAYTVTDPWTVVIIFLNTVYFHALVAVGTVPCSRRLFGHAERT